MRVTENRFIYVFSHEEARRLMVSLEREPLTGYGRLRKDLDLHPEAFVRLVYRLSGYGLLRMRGRPGPAARGRGLAVQLEITPRGRALLQVLRRMGEVAKASRHELDASTVELLTVA